MISQCFACLASHKTKTKRVKQPLQCLHALFALLSRKCFTSKQHSLSNIVIKDLCLLHYLDSKYYTSNSTEAHWLNEEWCCFTLPGFDPELRLMSVCTCGLFPWCSSFLPQTCHAFISPQGVNECVNVCTFPSVQRTFLLFHSLDWIQHDRDQDTSATENELLFQLLSLLSSLYDRVLKPIGFPVYVVRLRVQSLSNSCTLIEESQLG